MIDIEDALRATLRREAERVVLPRDFDARVAVRRRGLRRWRVVAAVAALGAVIAGVIVFAARDSGESPTQIVSEPELSTTTVTTRSRNADACTTPELRSSAPEVKRLAGTQTVRFVVTNVSARRCLLDGGVRLELLIGQSASVFEGVGSSVARLALDPGMSATISLLTTSNLTLPGLTCPRATLPARIDAMRILVGEAWFGGTAVDMGPFVCYQGGALGQLELVEPAVEVRTITSPLGRRVAPNMVWTGREVMVWGGSTNGNVQFSGALFDPVANSARSVAPSPIQGSPVAATLDGRKVFFFGSYAAHFDPDTNTWQSLTPIVAKNAPLLFAYGGIAYAYNFEGESQLIQIETRAPGGLISPLARPLPRAISDAASATKMGIEIAFLEGRAGQAFSISTGRFREMAPAPVEIIPGLATWNGKRLIAYGRSNTVPGLLVGAAYDPAADRWENLPSIPVPAPWIDYSLIRPQLVWVGQKAVLKTAMDQRTARVYIVDPELGNAVGVNFTDRLEELTPLVNSADEAFVLLANGALAAIEVA